MPRKRKSQAAQVPTGLPYGQGVALADAQRQQPLPGPGARPQAGGSGGRVPPTNRTATAAPGEQPPAPQDPMAAAIAAAQGMAPPPGGLARPSGRPDEAVTAGLRVGPGAGPEALPIPLLSEDDDTLLDLLNAYKVSPSPALRRYIELHRNRLAARMSMASAGRQAQRRGY